MLRIREIGASTESTSLRGKRVLALSAIGTPVGFEKLLASTGATVISLRLGDHAEYDDRSIARILNTARESESDLIVTTTKDEVKLLPLLSGKQIATPFFVAETTIAVTEGNEVFVRALDTVCIPRQS